MNTLDKFVIVNTSKKKFFDYYSRVQFIVIVINDIKENFNFQLNCYIVLYILGKFVEKNHILCYNLSTNPHIFIYSY